MFSRVSATDTCSQVMAKETDFPIVINGQRVPHIAAKVFRNMAYFDIKTLEKCKTVSKSWESMIDLITEPLRKKHLKDLKDALRDGRNDICKEVIQRLENKNPMLSRELWNRETALE